MNERTLNQHGRLQRIPARIAALLLLFGLSMAMHTANSQVAGPQGAGASAGSPKNNEVVAVVFLNVARSFKVDSVQLVIDGAPVSTRAFGKEEIAAFRSGTVLTQFQGSLPNGQHQVTVFYTGVDGQNRAFKREGSFVVTKGNGPKYVQLTISDAADQDRPTFSMHDW